jgi:demethylsterigmatocystin 6-O-methyltransferase
LYGGSTKKSSGAKYYFLSNILHDYPDDRCIQILQHLKDAMDTNSVILIKELVLPTTKALSYAVQIDIAMMIAVAAMERTEKQWHSLVDRAGLKIKKITSYDDLVCY